MATDTYHRAEVDVTEESDSPGRIRSAIDTLFSSAEQTVETVTRQTRFDISSGNVDEIDAPDDLDELVDLAKDVGFVWRSYEVFTNEVWKPGYRLEADDETTKAYFLGDVEDVDANPPEDTPEGGFLSNAAVFAGEKMQDFGDIGKAATFQRRLRGTVLVELLKKDQDNPESEITGFYFIRPETVSAQTYPNTNILIDPDDTDQSGVTLTRRGEAAAYIQFHEQSILGRRGRFDDRDQDEIPLSQNDVHKQVLNPGIGDDPDSDTTATGIDQGVFGTPGMRPIKQDVTEYRDIKRDEAQAIKRKAYGVWAMEFGRDVLDLGNGEKEIIEWDDPSMDDLTSEIEGLGPGDIANYDGTITLKEFESSVPELNDTLKRRVDDIFAGLPVSKYKVGFADDINRDVTSEQSDSDALEIQGERKYQERQWSKVLRDVAERKGLDPSGLRLKIEPEPEDSPVMSLSSDEIDKLATYAEALNALAGPQGGPQTLVDAETLLTDIAQLPESSIQGLGEAMDELPEEDADTMADFMDVMDLDPLAEWRDGEQVETPDGMGVIDDVIESGTVDGMDASEDDPVYAVVVEDGRVGVGFYRGDELSDGEIPETDGSPEDLGGEDDTNADTYQEGHFEWPQSWKDADKPARLIALDVWTSMRASFDGCVREMRGEVASPDRFCADFKDRLYGTEQWRGGWAD